jgi:hypothetical protein
MKVLAARAHDELAGSMLRVCTLREQEVVVFDLEVARDKIIAARARHDRGPPPGRAASRDHLRRARRWLAQPTATASASSTVSQALASAVAGVRHSDTAIWK